MSRNVREFDIPGDLPRMAALGIGRRRLHTARSLASRLDCLDACMQFGICPDLKGERDVENGRVTYDTIPLPEELYPHKQDLRTGVSACRRMLDSGDLESARERLAEIEMLVEDMKERAAKTAHQLARDTLERQKKGGRGREGKLKKTTIEALKLLGKGRNVKMVAVELGLTVENVRRIRRQEKLRAAKRGAQVG